MFAGGTKLAGVLSVFVAGLLLAGVAWAEGSEKPGPGGTDSPDKTGTQQKAAPGGDAEPKDTQTQINLADSRIRALDQRTRKLNRDLEAQRDAASDSQARFKQRARAAYKGGDLNDISIALDSLFSGDGTRINAVLNGSTARALTKGHGSIQFNQDSKRSLEQTIRQLEAKKVAYSKLREEQRARAEELRKREAPSSKKAQMEDRIAELQVAEEAGAFTRPPASDSGDGGAEMRERELEIASEDIVATPVEPIPYERYVQIYKASAKRYGFTEDWYVLAAVGKVESNHGESMGPSSAGAMGPMQFLPSTWQQYGVDGNGDGEANIMDPEDAIPAAASYLKAGGAPEDWYAALYTYNRAGRYVREVLGVAETYRQQGGGDEVEP